VLGLLEEQRGDSATSKYLCHRKVDRVRELTSRYLAFLPPKARSNFFSALDQYQCKLILDTLKSSSSEAGSVSLFSLPPSTIQLLFSGPSLLANAEISTALDNAITRHYSSAQPNITSFGLSPLMIRLLSSASAKRRSWALSQLPACSRRPVSFDHWCDSGLGEQVQTLYTGTGDASQEERLKGMEALLRCGALSADATEKGLIEGRLQQEGDENGQQGFMSFLSHLLGSPSACKSKSRPNWTTLTSPRLPNDSELLRATSIDLSFTDCMVFRYVSRITSYPILGNQGQHLVPRSHHAALSGVRPPDTSLPGYIKYYLKRERQGIRSRKPVILDHQFSLVPCSCQSREA
jgi:hypothetical protein